MSMPLGFGGPLSAQPERRALSLGGASWTWAELGERVEQTSRALSKAGAGPGVRVILPATATYETVVGVWSTLAVGADAVPLSPQLPAAERQRRSDAVGAGCVLDGRDIRSLRTARKTDTTAGEAALLVFTSGTTSAARAVVLPRPALVASADGVVAGTGLRPDDVWLDPLPLAHVGGLGVLFRCARTGAEAVLTDGFDAVILRSILASRPVTHASLVARMLDRLLDAPVDSESLRCVLVGGGRTEPELLRRARRAGLPAVSTYGLSEAGSTVTLQRPDQAVGRAGDAGWPLPGREVRIADDGEIEVSGACVMAGYDGGPRAGRWLRTGDRGRLLEDGRLVVQDRRTDLIVTGGENVSPVDVEAAIAALPGVHEVCVLGLPHPSWGQEVVAVVRWRVGPDLDAARRSVEHLAPWQRPRRWVDRREPLPRNALGKLLRKQTREQLVEVPAD